ncbi:hypothetical protein Bca4012_078423 [Brassica carinata]
MSTPSGEIAPPAKASGSLWVPSFPLSWLMLYPTAFRFSIAASGEDGVSLGCLRFAGFLGGTTCRAGISQCRGYFI